MGKIEPIEDVERRREIRNIGKRLFKSQDIREMVFKPEVEACLMFFLPDPAVATISRITLFLIVYSSRGASICAGLPTQKRTLIPVVLPSSNFVQFIQ